MCSYLIMLFDVLTMKYRVSTGIQPEIMGLGLVGLTMFDPRTQGLFSQPMLE